MFNVWLLFVVNFFHVLGVHSVTLRFLAETVGYPYGLLTLYTGTLVQWRPTAWDDKWTLHVFHGRSCGCQALMPLNSCATNSGLEIPAGPLARG